MKFTLAFSALLATTTALSIVSSRSLTEREESDLSSRNLVKPTCPKNGNLPEKDYLSPTLMVPISKSLPDLAFGSTNRPTITPNDICTIFNLEIPGSAFGKDCTLEFLFPKFPLQTSDFYVYRGQGHFTFTGYAFGTGATLKTTYNNQPPAGPSPPQPPAVLAPGNAYVINVGPCGIPAGQKSMTVSGALCSTDTTFIFKQDSSTCPIGFFVVIS
ncbi:hypothetical protein HYALB_00000629 [Hymenoscyphus albidus]|uniref:Ubiquitin 3 binding protein But2 C-terminal domain-containing protein n=1 Tax=Hymenoscyphus albidus TaxID=595503 RepID=A0A9N9Q835_9HELO|nr:hypothetical protein HYALB_00000629 [Hymenoscyphus albidus]